MERLSENKSEKDVLPRLEMMELKERHLLDDHSWAYIWGLKSDFVDFCKKAKPHDEIRVEATFVDEISVGLEDYSDPPHGPENPKYPDRGYPPLTTMLDLEFLDVDESISLMRYIFVVKNMGCLPLKYYIYQDGNDYRSVALDPPENTLAILDASVIKSNSKLDLVIVRHDQTNYFRKNPNI